MSAPQLLTRRSLLRGTLVLSAGAAAGCFRQNEKQASLRLLPGPSVSVPDNFIGFGYEMSSAAQLGLLSARVHKKERPPTKAA